MLPDKNIRCPATGFAKSCREIISEFECPKFVKISGQNPNDGQPVDRFGCVDSFIPMLMIENSQMQRQTGAAVESFRNEMTKANGQANSQAGLALLAAVEHEQRRLTS